MKSVRKKTGKNKYFEESDSFLSFTEKVKLYVQDNPSQAYGALIALGAVIAITVVVTLLIDAKATRVQVIQAEALAYYDVISPSPSGEPLPDNERYEKAAELFDKLEDQAGGGTGMLGTYYEANAKYKLGNIEEAVEGYRSLFERRPGTLMGSLAGLRLASLQLERGETEAAIGVLSSLSETGGYLRDEALFLLGELYELTGRQTEAGSAYSKIASEYNNSPWAGEANAKLKRLMEEAMGEQEGGAVTADTPIKTE